MNKNPSRFNKSDDKQLKMAKDNGQIFNTGYVIHEKYVILDLIGKGAFGEVYRAHQLNLQRDVAIKVVSQQWLESQEIDSDEIDAALQRFRREVQAMARVRHLNILQIFDHGSISIKKEDTDLPLEFIVMEYIPGETLRHTMSEEGFYPEEELAAKWLQDYFLPVLNGAMAIHALDIVHRDLKPENILIDGRIPKIADFGLARSSRLKPVTQSVEVKGTAHYMSPEHFFDFRKADQRADIYSLGKILYEAIDGKIGQGKMPFKTAKLSVAETSFFQKLDSIIQSATVEKKEDRLDSIAKFSELLREAIDLSRNDGTKIASIKSQRPTPWQKPQWIWAGIFVAVISVASMSIWHLMDKPTTVSQPSAKEPLTDMGAANSDRPDTQAELIAPTGTPEPSILAEDGATLLLIPGGTTTISETSDDGRGATIQVDPFYLDETLVTNHQYVEFLNHHTSILQAADGVVRSDGQIWLLLGEVREAYEPIMFRKGEFIVSKVAYAALPVLRVTAYGATAYARFYNRRLPTYIEWLHAMGANEVELKKDASPGGKQMHANMHGQSALSEVSPVIDFAPDRYGIRGMNKSISEWGMGHVDVDSAGESNEIEYVVMGHGEKPPAETPIRPSAIPRHPWEAFEKVGFRCARNIIATEN